MRKMSSTRIKLNVSVCSSEADLKDFSIFVNKSLSLVKIFELILTKLSSLEKSNFTFGFYIDSKLVCLMNSEGTKLYKRCKITDFESNIVDVVVSRKE